MIDAAITGIVVWTIGTTFHILQAGSMEEYLSFYVNYKEHKPLTITAWIFFAYFIASVVVLIFYVG